MLVALKYPLAYYQASLNSLGLTLGGKYYEILISYDDILLLFAKMQQKLSTQIFA
jgi:hypothetical protein